MKKIFWALSFVCLLFLGGGGVVSAAEGKPSATAAQADAAKPAAKTEANKKRPHVRFRCTKDECVCHGGADCNDLGSTRLCRIDMTCNGQTCRCSRN